jgi:hypothetical protein
MKGDMKGVCVCVCVCVSVYYKHSLWSQVTYVGILLFQFLVVRYWTKVLMDHPYRGMMKIESYYMGRTEKCLDIIMTSTQSVKLLLLLSLKMFS